MMHFRAQSAWGVMLLFAGIEIETKDDKQAMGGMRRLFRHHRAPPPVLGRSSFTWTQTVDGVRQEFTETTVSIDGKTYKNITSRVLRQDAFPPLERNLRAALNYGL